MPTGSVATVPDILARIVERKAEELGRPRIPVHELEQRAATFVRRSFRQALTAKKPAIIGEIKKGVAQPGCFGCELRSGGHRPAIRSGGRRRDFGPYRSRLSSKALSDNLEAARAAATLPVLRKDFTTAEYHVAEAAAHGADAILLIAAILDSQQLASFRQIASSFRMDALVEVHDEAELERALKSGAEIIGVNNRDLRTFEVRLEISHRLAERIPRGIVRVTESGVFTADHVRELSAYDAFLVGESLMRAPDPVAALRALCL